MLNRSSLSSACDNTAHIKKGFLFIYFQIKFWKTDVGITTSSCDNKGYDKPSMTRDVGTGHIYILWPFTNITAHIVALNAKYEGQPSLPVCFTTKEGGEYLFVFRHLSRQIMETKNNSDHLKSWRLWTLRRFHNDPYFSET